MSFENKYYKRTAATAKACYVCHKPTTTVLATINTTDFIYACPTHLSDPGFATRIQDEKAKPSEEEIQRVKKEWEEKQKKKKEEKKEEKTDEKKEEKTDEKKEEKPVSPPPAPTPVVHEKYALHRDMFSSNASIRTPQKTADSAGKGTRSTFTRRSYQ
ncbi:hypothetical protein AAF712_002209 [Marasmius tenuissimus]|uniref:DUF1742-domain-containing protein n=1 Tax=Marasmius tenuissimus TaxID=585030 RepID=A0ABR2ZB53_9AGAR